LLLLVVFCFSFLLRASIVFHNPYPPSSDIGFHGSIINLILDQKTLPTWNPYHMGGEPLVTPPGFHFFVSILILLTGMPITIAELISATFFSAVIVFPAYIISKRIWKNVNAGLLAAFFASISGLSIEMLTWGGYPNIISLFLIIIIFYLVLRESNKPTIKHMILGALLFSTLILTHTFSLAVFFPILTVYLVMLIIGKLRKNKETKIKCNLRFFVTSAALGLLLIIPWILQVFTFYVNATIEGTITGGLENTNLILANCKIDPITLTLIIAIIPTLVLLKKTRKTYFDRSSLLLISWFLVPIIMTQSYIFNIYTHYSRFLYFLDFPLIIILSAILLYIYRIGTFPIVHLTKNFGNKVKNTLRVLILTVIIFLFIIFSSWSMFPNDGLKEANTYSTIQQPEATTLNWMQINTPEDTVVVADHLYGWWISGIAKRATISAVDLQFLLYSHEMDGARNALLLLDTDYYIDNGLIQIKDDGPYMMRHNPEIGTKTNSGKNLALFEFNEIQLEYNQKSVPLSNMSVTQNKLTEYENLSVCLTATYENEQYEVNKKLYAYPGVGCTDLVYEIESKNIQNNDEFQIILSLSSEANQNLTIVDSLNSKEIWAYDSYHKIAGQIIFEEQTPQIEIEKNATNNAEIIYSTSNKSMQIIMLVRVFEVDNLTHPDYTQMYETLAKNSLEAISSDVEMNTWKYTDMLEKFDVSYVICRDKSVFTKFMKDPNFQLLFNCGNITIFQVKK
jgi:hypothetical protein